MPISSDKIDKHEYLLGDKILPFDHSRIIGQDKFTYSTLGKAFEKQINTAENQGIKEVESLRILRPEESQQDLKLIEGVFRKKMTTNEIKNEIDEIKK